MEISGNEDTALSSTTIHSVYLITYSQADTMQFTRERLLLLSLMLRMEWLPDFCDGFAHLSHTRLVLSISTLQLSWTRFVIVTKTDKNFVQSNDHPDLNAATAPQTCTATSEKHKNCTSKNAPKPIKSKLDNFTMSETILKKY